MTFTEKQESINGYYINMEIDKTGVYHVSICREYEKGFCGYPLKEIRTADRKKALATYNRYKREI